MKSKMGERIFLFSLFAEKILDDDNAEEYEKMISTGRVQMKFY